MKLQEANEVLKTTNEEIRNFIQYTEKIEKAYLKEKERTQELEYVLEQVQSQLSDVMADDSILLTIIKNALKR